MTTVPFQILAQSGRSKSAILTCESTRVKSRDLVGSGGYYTLLRDLLFAGNSTSGTVRNAVRRSFSRSFQADFSAPAKLPF